MIYQESDAHMQPSGKRNSFDESLPAQQCKMLVQIAVWGGHAHPLTGPANSAKGLRALLLLRRSENSARSHRQCTYAKTE